MRSAEVGGVPPTVPILAPTAAEPPTVITGIGLVAEAGAEVLAPVGIRMVIPCVREPSVCVQTAWPMARLEIKVRPSAAAIRVLRYLISDLQKSGGWPGSTEPTA